MTIVEAARGVTGGVDTHLDVHVAAALDPLGGLLGTERFETNSAGYKALLAWLESFGDVTKIGIEGTGSMVRTVPLSAPSWRRGHRGRPTEPRGAPPQRQVRSPRCRRGRPGRPERSSERQPEVERRCRRGDPGLVVAKRSARQARVKALIQMRHLGYTAPEQLRCRLKGLSVPLLSPRGTSCGRPVHRIRSRLPPRRRCPRWRIASSARRRARGARREDRGAPRCHRARAPRALRRRTRHRSRTGDGGRRQPRPAAFRGRMGPPLRCRPSRRVGQDQRQGQGPRRWRSPGQQRAVAHRHGAHRSRPRDPALLRASSQGGEDQSRGHSHLEALRRPRGLSLPASRPNPRAVGSGFPPYCRSSELTLQRLADPQLGPTISKTRDLNRSLSPPRVTDQCRVRCFHSRAPKEGLTSDRSSPGWGATPCGTSEAGVRWWWDGPNSLLSAGGSPHCRNYWAPTGVGELPQPPRIRRQRSDGCWRGSTIPDRRGNPSASIRARSCSRSAIPIPLPR